MGWHGLILRQQLNMNMPDMDGKPANYPVKMEPSQASPYTLLIPPYKISM